MRTLSKTLIAAALSFAVVGTASAVELKPLKATSVDLGTYYGSIYYTPGSDGYRVVATLSARNIDGSEPKVVRLVTTLNANQSVTLSVPGTLNASGSEATVAFSRRGDVVDVASAD
ncbi:hypothetical protein [Methylobacterium trifolii]|uniref:Uncharacterized protein n=1 Tax=Methylobacterium trifolii TaxID=1003092 RepID=A0ABQ4U605_9HYPH|nr:hypothetical protein [Methylobacterium trifolii]GJE61822.1 hypothetical protein MPOCJGCO_3948 [Methylobacterium trifolii]